MNHRGADWKQNRSASEAEEKKNRSTGVNLYYNFALINWNERTEEQKNRKESTRIRTEEKNRSQHNNRRTEEMKRKAEPIAADRTAAEPAATTAAAERKKQREKEKNIPQELPKDFNLESYPKDPKGNYIVPDILFDQLYKILPDGTVNESRSTRAFHGGKLTILSNDARSKEIQRMGAEALNTSLAQRRTLAESLEIALRKPATLEEIERLHLQNGAVKQDAMTAAIIAEAINGNGKAWEIVRDTIGEKPVDRQEINAEVMTHEEKLLLGKIAARIQPAEQAAADTESE